MLIGERSEFSNACVSANAVPGNTERRRREQRLSRPSVGVVPAIRRCASTADADEAGLRLGTLRRGRRSAKGFDGLSVLRPRRRRRGHEDDADVGEYETQILHILRGKSLVSRC